MLKDCAALAFQKLPEEQRTLYYNRYGQWFETHGMLLHALYAYRNGKNYDALLRVTQKDAGHSAVLHAAGCGAEHAGRMP